MTNWVECKCDSCEYAFVVTKNNQQIQLCRNTEETVGCTWKGEIFKIDIND
jgi:hypothetical protein